MNSLADIITVVVIGLIGGAAVGLQVPASGAMSQRLGPVATSLIIHLGGALVSAILLIFVGGVNLSEVNSLPRPFLLAGVSGVILYLTLSFTLPRAGGTFSVALLILAELLVGIIVDHFGLFGMPQHTFNATRALGVTLLIAGTWLVTK
ncbi:MAG TPA: DMT family transporter [Phototrophicaceae bacterium]|nr:DMT family transporter [Phototrophicaceae bacterium]